MNFICSNPKDVNLDHLETAFCICSFIRLLLNLESIADLTPYQISVTFRTGDFVDALKILLEKEVSLFSDVRRIRVFLHLLSVCLVSSGASKQTDLDRSIVDFFLAAPRTRQFTKNDNDAFYFDIVHAIDFFPLTSDYFLSNGSDTIMLHALDKRLQLKEVSICYSYYNSINSKRHCKD